MTNGDRQTRHPPQEVDEKPSLIHSPSVRLQNSAFKSSNCIFIGDVPILNSTSNNLVSKTSRTSTAILQRNRVSTHQGRSSVIFKESERKQLISRLKHVVIAKFSHGRPSSQAFHNFMRELQLQGDYHVSLFDAKHIFIELQVFDDFTKLWLRRNCSVKGYHVRFFKWSEKFTSNKESSIVPVWIHLPGLPIYFYEEEALLSIANAIGKPLKIDRRNLDRTNLGYATVCVELDVTRLPLNEIWIEFEEDDSNNKVDGFWQKIIYGDIPSFCSGCFHLGHPVGECKRVLASLGSKGTASSHLDDKLVQDKRQLGVLQEGEILEAMGENSGSKEVTLSMNNMQKSGAILDAETGAMPVAEAAAIPAVDGLHRGTSCNISATQEEEVLVEDVTLEEGEIAEEDELESVAGDPAAGKCAAAAPSAGANQADVYAAAFVGNAGSAESSNEVVRVGNPGGVDNTARQKRDPMAAVSNAAVSNVSVSAGENEGQGAISPTQADCCRDGFDLQCLKCVAAAGPTPQLRAAITEQDRPAIAVQKEVRAGVPAEQEVLHSAEQEVLHSGAEMENTGLEVATSWADAMDLHEAGQSFSSNGRQFAGVMGAADGQLRAAAVPEIVTNTGDKKGNEEQITDQLCADQDYADQKEFGPQGTNIGADSELQVCQFLQQVEGFQETTQTIKELAAKQIKASVPAGNSYIGKTETWADLANKEHVKQKEFGTELKYSGSGQTTQQLEVQPCAPDLAITADCNSDDGSEHERHTETAENELVEANKGMKQLDGMLVNSLVQDASHSVGNEGMSCTSTKEELRTTPYCANVLVEEGTNPKCLWPSKQQVEELTERMNRLRGKEPDRREEVVVSGNNSNNHADLALHLQQTGMNSRSVKHVVLQTHTMAADVKEVGSEEQEKREQAALVLLETKGVWSALEETAIDDFQMFMASPKRIGPVFARTICSEVVRNSPKIAGVRKHFKFLSNKEQTTSLVEQGKLDDMLKDAMNEYTKEIYQALLEQDKSIYLENSTTEKVTPQTQEAILKVSTMDEKEWSTPKRRGRNRTRTNNI